jgi:hypothetical protein
LGNAASLSFDYLKENNGIESNKEEEIDGYS